MIQDVDTLRERARYRIPVRAAVLLTLFGAAYVLADYASFGTVDVAFVCRFELPMLMGFFVGVILITRRARPSRISPAAGLRLADRWRVMSGLARGRFDPDPHYRVVQEVELERLWEASRAWPIWLLLSAGNWWLFSLSVGHQTQWTGALVAGLFTVIATSTAVQWFGARRIVRRR